MPGYTKLFQSIITSSIWEEDLHVRVVWTALLALCGPKGIAEVSDTSLPRVANVTPEQCAEAVQILMSPDPSSRSKVDEGRRIRRVDGGYFLINYAHYRGEMCAEKKKKYMRDYQRTKRAEAKAKTRKGYIKTSRSMVTDAEEWRDSLRLQAEAACAMPLPEALPAQVKAALSSFSDHRFILATEGHTKQDCRRWTTANYQSLIRQTENALTKASAEFVTQRIEQATTSGYRGVAFNNFFNS